MLRDLLFTLFHPSFWIQIYPTSREWSDAVEIALREGASIIWTGSYTVMIGQQEVWVSGYPFAYGKPWGVDGAEEVLPRPFVRKKLKQAVDSIRNLEKDAFIEQAARRVLSKDAP